MTAAPMTTYAEEVRMVLAEVAPEVAATVGEPKGSWWARISIKASTTHEEYQLIRRAGHLVRERRGLSEPRACDDCAWAAFSTRDNEAKARHASEGCGHL